MSNIYAFKTVLCAPEFQRYLFEHEHDDEQKVILKNKDVFGVPAKVVGAQLAGRRKARTKLPQWYQTKGILYPPNINLEQCSSQATATFKASILKENLQSFSTGADLTAGFGVDSYFLSRAFTEFHYVDPDENLLLLAQHNHRLLSTAFLLYHSQTAQDYLRDAPSLDFIFIDPSRRNDSQKVFRLADCTPDVVSLQQTLLEKSRVVLIKCSPMLDIKQALDDLEFVKQVWVVAVANECKELCFLLERGFEGEPKISAVELAVDGFTKHRFDFLRSQEQQATPGFSEPQCYLYEPNAAILKSGAYKSVATRFGLEKIDLHTHLYTSPSLVANFPGRIFEVAQLRVTENELTSLTKGKANVVTRNYPLSADELKQKLKLTDGGEWYVIGYTKQKEKYVSLAKRIQ